MEIVFKTKNKELIEQVNSLINEWNSDADYISVQTSGSTGNPKTIHLRKRHMKASAEMTGLFLGLEKGISALLCLSTMTIGGKMMIIRSLVLDMKLIVVDVNNQPLSLVDENIGFAAMAPSQVQNSIINSKESLRDIDHLIIGGAPISEELNRDIIDLGMNAYQTFGMTETISHIAMRKLTLGNSYYRTLPNIDISETNGQLVVHAPSIGVERLLTNDIVEINNPNTFTWLGRSDFTINSGGIKIQPEQVEIKLRAIIDKPFISTGIEDETLGSKHVLIIESDEPKYQKEDFIDLLDQYQAPKEIYYVPKLIFTTNKKIDRIKTLNLISNAQKQIL